VNTAADLPPELKFDWAKSLSAYPVRSCGLFTALWVQWPQELICRRCQPVRAITLSCACYFRNTFITDPLGSWELWGLVQLPCGHDPSTSPPFSMTRRVAQMCSMSGCITAQNIHASKGVRAGENRGRRPWRRRCPQQPRPAAGCATSSRR
jgi:hypothetical protein